MKTTKNITKFAIGVLMLAGLAINATHGQAAGFNKYSPNNGKAISTEKFQQILNNTQPTQLPVNFGFPDEIQTLKSVSGNVEGVVWIYRDAIVKQNGKQQDVRFVLVDGVMKYFTLSNAS